MLQQISKIKKLWNFSISTRLATADDISKFESKNCVRIPNDLKLFFKLLNGTNGEYDQRFFQFYSLDEFRPIASEFKDWIGLAPDYGNLINMLLDHHKFFVFANYQSYLFSYCIKLDKRQSEQNEVYILCGDEYKVIAGTFTEFLDLYISDDDKLQF